MTLRRAVSQTIQASTVRPCTVIISDIVSAYAYTHVGDDNLKTALEKRADSFDPALYWSLHPPKPAVIAHNNMAVAASSTASSEELYNMYKGDPCSRQMDETVDAFLTRLPPLTTTSGPWIRIGNPHSNFRHTLEDRSGFIEKGKELLEEFATAKARIESSMVGESQPAIARNVKPLRQELEKDLFKTAQATGCKTGKWMLFPAPDRVNSAWSKIAKATANNELGLAAKVAAAVSDEEDPNKARLICIYTDDFEDKKDVKRVCQRLAALGFVNGTGATGEGRAIYYKADAYTYLNIMGGNGYGLKASMHSSREILKKGD